MLGDLRATIHHILKETKYIFAEVNKYMHHLPFSTNSQRPPKVVHHIRHAHSTNSQRSPKFVHHLSHIRIGLRMLYTIWMRCTFGWVIVNRMLCTTWNIFAEACESYAPLGTYLLGSPSILREACQSFSTNGTTYRRHKTCVMGC